MVIVTRRGASQEEQRTPPLVVFAGGGTGGHLYPALAVADCLRKRLPGVRFLFLGTTRAMDERILGQTGCDLIRQPLAAIRIAPWCWPRMVIGFQRSSRLCRSLFHRSAPLLVIGTGGLACVPAVRQAVRLGIPTVLLNPDALPGRANRYLARSVDRVFVQWEQTVGCFPRTARVEVSGCAVRESFRRATRTAGVERFGLDPGRKTLLITGASQGAHTINQAVVANLDFLETLDSWQVLHVTGERDFEEVRSAYGARSIPGSVQPYTDRMAQALAAADLVIARAGASSLAEIAALGRAAILMPYPYHKDQHQLANARCLASGPDPSAAYILHDRIDPRINGPALREVLEQLTKDDQRREAMACAARQMGRPEAAERITDSLLAMADRGP